MGNHFRSYPSITLHILDTLIRPILLFNSDFWGCLKMPSNNPIENTHMKFCKQLLGVQKQTPNAGVLLELGRIPIALYGQKNCIKNWARVATEKKANTLMLLSFEYSQQKNLNWTESVKSQLDNMGIGRGNKNPHLATTALKRMVSFTKMLLVKSLKTNLGLMLKSKKI